ncbi:ribonuclease P protein subunit p20-like [Paramacrobiotus metropolitanus]|uniref:ribonuclease P protein subunit p20-like n=1 Tax=Paramacrobiotus metropolitanus TaxID=2943436 RepID=UPI002445B988|nr:ribonuclease P protein subunit p20-like [Paramacrobiotus metropolitanus]
MADGDGAPATSGPKKMSSSGKNPATPAHPYPRTSKPSHSQHDQPSTSKLPPLDYDPAEYQLVRHLPRQHPRGPHDVYITLKTAFKAQMQRCRRMLEAPGCPGITLHGLGAAANRAVNLALQLCSEYTGLLQLHATTGSMPMTQELEPLRDDLDPVSQTRFISAIHIRVYFVKTLEDLKKKKP